MEEKRAFRRGDTTVSLAGKDKGLPLAVLYVEDGGVFLANGREHPLERPKRKNPRHLAAPAAVLDEGSMATNRELRRALAALYRPADSSPDGRDSHKWEVCTCPKRT